MNSNPLLINGVGTLDWKGFAKSGGQSTIRFWIYKTIISKDKEGQKVSKTIKARLPENMVINLTLTLSAKRRMPYCISESGTIDDKGEISILRRSRGEQRGAMPKIDKDFTNSKFNLRTKKTLLALTKELKAFKLTYEINSNKPETIKISAIIKRHTLNLPARFIVDLVTNINYLLLSE